MGIILFFSAKSIQQITECNKLKRPLPLPSCWITRKLISGFNFPYDFLLSWSGLINFNFKIIKKLFFVPYEMIFFFKLIPLKKIYMLIQSHFLIQY